MKSNLLSDEELAALSEGVRDGSIETDMINERFIRMFRLGLVEMLRSSPKVNPSQVQIVRFGDYLKGLQAPMSVNVVRVNPLRGYSIVVLDPTVVFSSLDSFFGGFGKGVGQLPSGRLFTPTETRIINMILDVFFRCLKEAWSPVMPLDFELVSSEINPQFAQIADENDLVILSRFDAEGNLDAKGFIDLVHPYASLKPIREILHRKNNGPKNSRWPSTAPAWSCVCCWARLTLPSARSKRWKKVTFYFSKSQSTPACW